jgi:hypothetical protein
MMVDGDSRFPWNFSGITTRVLLLYFWIVPVYCAELEKLAKILENLGNAKIEDHFV